MKFEELKKEVRRIANMKNSKKALEEMKILAERVNETKIKIQPRGNYVYFYPREYFYDPDKSRGNSRLGERMGKIPIKTYEKEKERFNSMSHRELEQYFETQKVKG